MRLDLFILLLVVAIVLYRWYQKTHKPKGYGPSSVEMIQDPNCETYVPETEAVRATIAGRDHYFCSEKCAGEYRKKLSAV